MAARNEHLTHKGNVGVGRHGWLRLTPAYGVNVVRNAVRDLPAEVVVTDPFSGTGTTPLAAAEHGGRGQSIDVNPFLIWLGNAKLHRYTDAELSAAEAALVEVTRGAQDVMADESLWQPALFKIERWWSRSALSALRGIRASIDAVPSTPGRDLLEVALCRTLIGVSNAAFNHQSMSFKDTDATAYRLFEVDEASAVVERYARDAREVLTAAAIDLPGSGVVVEGDSRNIEPTKLPQCDLLLTSPPYVNRMSYIRELRPYMYWTRTLTTSSEAGELDWLAIGGTWGCATSNLKTWASDETTPVHQQVRDVCEMMVRDGGKNGPLLATYVHKYFDDMWTHFQSAYKHVKSSGRASYIIGNSTFFGHVVPAEEWYAVMLREAGFVEVNVKNIRKRNSNKKLFEFDVSAVKP